MRFGLSFEFERQAEDDDTPAKGHWAKHSFLIARRTSYFGPFLTSKNSAEAVTEDVLLKHGAITPKYFASCGVDI